MFKSLSEAPGSRVVYFQTHRTILHHPAGAAWSAWVARWAALGPRDSAAMRRVSPKYVPRESATEGRLLREDWERRSEAPPAGQVPQ